MILILGLVLCGTLCYAQNKDFSPGTQVSQASSTQVSLGGNPFIGNSGSSSVARSPALATALTGTPDYALCVRSQPDTAVRSKSRLSYSLLKSTFTNSTLKDIYNTSFDGKEFFQAIYDELKVTWFHNARLFAGSFTLLFEHALPRVSPLVNAVTITNAVSDFLAIKVAITTEKFDDFVDAYIEDVSKGLRNEDGSKKSPAIAIVTALLNFLAFYGNLSYSSLHEFISILAGNYRLALYSTCLPTAFEEIPNI